MSQNRKMAFFCTRGDYNSGLAVFTLATSAAAMGYEVRMLFLHDGLHLVRPSVGVSASIRRLAAHVIYRLKGGRGAFPEAQISVPGLIQWSGQRARTPDRVAALSELIQSAAELEIPMFACEMAAALCGHKQKDFMPWLSGIISAAGFMTWAEGAEMITV